MPTVAELKRLAELEAAFGVQAGTHGIAVLEVCPSDPPPAIEFEDFTGLTVIVLNGAMKSGEFRATVNGEHRAGLPPREYTPWVAANDGTQASLAKAPSSSFDLNVPANSRGT